MSVGNRRYADYVVNADKVRAVEEVERFEGQFEVFAFGERESTSQPHVDIVKRLAPAGITTQI